MYGLVVMLTIPTSKVHTPKYFYNSIDNSSINWCNFMRFIGRRYCKSDFRASIYASWKFHKIVVVFKLLFYIDAFLKLEILWFYDLPPLCFRICHEFHEKSHLLNNTTKIIGVVLISWRNFMRFIRRRYCEYRTRAIISRGLYTFLPRLQRPFMYCDLWPYVWVVFKSGF